MKTHFLDSSAIAKLYHVEAGTAQVHALAQDPGNECIISQLSTVEICSVFALKTRTGSIGPQGFSQVTGRFFADLKRGRFKVLVIEPLHIQLAQDLIIKYGLTHGLRTLDAVQLAMAMHLRQAASVDVFVASDVRLGAVALAEGFTVLNPAI